MKRGAWPPARESLSEPVAARQPAEDCVCDSPPSRRKPARRGPSGSSTASSYWALRSSFPNRVPRTFSAILPSLTIPTIPEQLIGAARKFASQWGAIERIVAVHETLLAPVARASEALGLPGMSESTVLRALDKSNLKQVLQRAGIETARDQVVTAALDARRFVDQVGFPLVLKPLTGSGGLGTWRIGTHEQLELALDLLKPSPENAVLFEEHLDGQELCIDTVTIADEPRFYSLCIYRPTILEALDDPRVQWRCVMPRDITAERYRNFIEQGLAAVRALAVGNAMTHLEGFLLEGGRVRFTDATLRPAGARIGPMLAFAYDIDPYRVWARVAVDGCFDGPWERKYAVGTVFLRGAGQGQVQRVEGLEEVRRRLGDGLVDSRLPRIGGSKSHTYTGDGYITVRHPETDDGGGSIWTS